MFRRVARVRYAVMLRVLLIHSVLYERFPLELVSMIRRVSVSFMRSSTELINAGLYDNCQGFIKNTELL